MKRLTEIVLLLLSLLAGPVFAACSGQQGRVVINEYNYIENYIELKVLDPAVLSETGNLNGWGMVLKKSAGKSPDPVDIGAIVVDATKNTCAATTATYIQIPFSSNEMSNDVDVLLTDEDGNEVDLFRVRQSASSDPLIETTCSSWPYDTALDPDLSSSNPKDIARYPDGTGNWAVSPGNGNGSFKTLCTSNNDVAKLTKTVNVTEAAPGTTVVYTVSLTNRTGQDEIRWPYWPTYDPPIK